MPKTDFTRLTDEELVHRYRNSHETVYVGELYQRYTHLVFGVCLKYMKDDARAEDATMQIFENLITDLKKHHVTAFKPWLHTVTKNYCMMEFRKTAGEQKHQTALKYEMGGIVENPLAPHLTVDEDEVDKEFVLEHLQGFIGELKEEHRTCIELFYLKGCSYAEVSTITGFSMNEVKSYIQNGKKNLKNHITAKNEQGKK